MIARRIEIRTQKLAICEGREDAAPVNRLMDEELVPAGSGGGRLTLYGRIDTALQQRES